MGLDNIPNEYPCQARGRAVFVPDLYEDGTQKLHLDGTPKLAFSCTATREAGVCPLLLAPDRPENGAVTGMFGTPCWYRGKWGSRLLEGLGINDDQLYGGENDRLSSEGCDDLANFIDEELDTWLGEHEGKFILDDEDCTDDVRYLIWWLRFVAREADGMNAWY